MWPRPESTFTISRTTSGSSSMTRTRAMAILVDHGAQAGLRDRRLPVALVDEVRADHAVAIDQRALGHRLDAPRRGDRADVAVAGRADRGTRWNGTPLGQRALVGVERLRRSCTVPAALGSFALGASASTIASSTSAPAPVGGERDHDEVIAREVARPCSSSCGFSVLQTPHHDAQKLSSTTLPRKSRELDRLALVVERREVRRRERAARRAGRPGTAPG